MRHGSSTMASTATGLLALLTSLTIVPRNDVIGGVTASPATEDPRLPPLIFPSGTDEYGPVIPYNETIARMLGYGTNGYRDAPDDPDIDYSGDAILVQDGPAHDPDAPEEAYGGAVPPSDLLVLDDITGIETPWPVATAFRTLHVAWPVAAIVVLLLAVVVYSALAVYRSRLAHRYGMRQRLVIDDSYYHNNEARYFDGPDRNGAEP